MTDIASHGHDGVGWFVTARAPRTSRRIAPRRRDFDERGPHERGAGKAVPLAANDAVVLNFICVCAGMSEHELMNLARENTLGNASVMRLTRAAGEQLWNRESFAFDAHVEGDGVGATKHTGDKRADIH